MFESNIALRLNVASSVSNSALYLIDTGYCTIYHAPNSISKPVMSYIIVWILFTPAFVFTIVM